MASRSFTSCGSSLSTMHHKHNELSTRFVNRVSHGSTEFLIGTAVCVADFAQQFCLVDHFPSLQNFVCPFSWVRVQRVPSAPQDVPELSHSPGFVWIQQIELLLQLLHLPLVPLDQLAQVHQLVPHLVRRFALDELARHGVDLHARVSTNTCLKAQ